jgi:hypothetical protein
VSLPIRLVRVTDLAIGHAEFERHDALDDFVLDEALFTERRNELR